MLLAARVWTYATAAVAVLHPAHLTKLPKNENEVLVQQTALLRKRGLDVEVGSLRVLTHFIWLVMRVNQQQVVADVLECAEGFLGAVCCRDCCGMFLNVLRASWEQIVVEIVVESIASSFADDVVTCLRASHKQVIAIMQLRLWRCCVMCALSRAGKKMLLYHAIFVSLLVFFGDAFSLLSCDSGAHRAFCTLAKKMALSLCRASCTLFLHADNKMAMSFSCASPAPASHHDVLV